MISAASTSAAANPATTSISMATALPSTTSDDISLSGTVWIDSNWNNTKDMGEYAIGGAVVTLATTDGTFTVTATTGLDGTYSFKNLLAGSYDVWTPTYPGLLINGTAIAGNDGGTVCNSTTTDGITVDMVKDITLVSGDPATSYDFTDLGLDPSLVSKRLFLASALGTSTFLVGPIPTVPEPGTFVLLAAAAACGGLAWRRRAARRKRLAANLNASIGVMGRTAQARRENDSSGEGRARKTSAQRGSSQNHSTRVIKCSLPILRSML